MTEYTIAQFTGGLTAWMPSISADIARGFSFNGGGGIENWLIGQYLLSFPAQQLATLDYMREYPKATPEFSRARRVDLAFNVQTVNPNTSPILSEWKCKPVPNELVTGFFTDANKFSPVLKTYENAALKPYPIFVGVSTLMDPTNVGAGISVTDLGNGMGLYLTTAASWSTFGLLQYTAYNNPSIPEQAVMAGTLANSGHRA